MKRLRYPEQLSSRILSPCISRMGVGFKLGDWVESHHADCATLWPDSVVMF